MIYGFYAHKYAHFFAVCVRFLFYPDDHFLSAMRAHDNGVLAGGLIPKEVAHAAPYYGGNLLQIFCRDTRIINRSTHLGLQYSQFISQLGNGYTVRPCY